MSTDEQRAGEAPEPSDDAQAEQGAEAYGGDPDAEPGVTEEDVEQASRREPTEG